MEEFVNTNKLKGFIRAEIKKHLISTKRDIDQLYSYVTKLREEFIVKRMKGGKIK